jgi:hypothetical protein
MLVSSKQRGLHDCRDLVTAASSSATTMYRQQNSQ